MKTNLLSIIAISATLLINSCKGPEGPIGPAGQTGSTGQTGGIGATGTPGTTGEKGEKGDKGDTGGTGAAGSKGDKGDTGATGAAGANGNANVVYNEWKSLTLDRVSSSRDSRGNYTFLILSPLEPKEPLFTKDAINTAAIYSYIKYTIVCNDLSSNRAEII